MMVPTPPTAQPRCRSNVCLFFIVRLLPLPWYMAGRRLPRRPTRDASRGAGVRFGSGAGAVRVRGGCALMALPPPPMPPEMRGGTAAVVVARVSERKLRELLASAVSANKEFDYLCFEAEQIPPSDFRDVLGAELTFLLQELDDLVRDAL